MSNNETKNEESSGVQNETNDVDLILENYENLDILWSLKNTILFISYGFLFLNGMYIMYNIYYIIPFFIIFLGVFGIAKYDKILSVYFIFYLVIKLAIDFYELINIKDEISSYIITLIIIFEIYVCELTIKYLIKIYNLSIVETELITSNYIPRNRRITLY